MGFGVQRGCCIFLGRGWAFVFLVLACAGWLFFWWALGCNGVDLNDVFGWRNNEVFYFCTATATYLVSLIVLR